METKKFKINSDVNANGEKKLTRSSILSKAGFTIAGGFVGAAATYAGSGKDPKEKTPEEKPANEEIANEQQPTVNPQNTDNQHTPVNQDEITEPQPIDNNQNSEGGYSEEIDANPSDVAQSIAEEIDANDIDGEVIITPDYYDYAYLPDGTRQAVLIGHTSDGEQYVIADLDGDGLYGDIFDINGYLVAQVDGLSVSDILDMVDDSGGFLAIITEPWEDDSIIPEQEPQMDEDDEEIDDDLEAELLAMLTEEDDDTDADIDRFFDEEEIGESEEGDCDEETDEDELNEDFENGEY